jgi:hypothetical protein
MSSECPEETGGPFMAVGLILIVAVIFFPLAVRLAVGVEDRISKRAIHRER